MGEINVAKEGANLEPDEFLLFREKLSQIDTLIDTRCCKEILDNFTLKELKVYMKETYEKMLYFLRTF